MSDLINRKQALDDARSWVGMNWYEQHLMRNVVEWLEEFPSPWIPVTERLPEKLDYYLISGNNSVWLARYKSGRFLGVLSGHALDTVIAWMPLPEPYKEVTE